MGNNYTTPETYKKYITDKNYEKLEKTLRKYPKYANITNENNISALILFSLDRTKFSMVKYLIENKADPNIQGKNGWTALMLASKYSGINNTFGTVKYLVENKADPNIQEKIGQTALMMSSKYSNTKSSFRTVKYLIENKADPNIQDRRGWTALMLASKYSGKSSTFGTVKCLIDNKADLEIHTKDGWSVLNLISDEKGKFKIIEYLLKKGANPNSYDKYGNTFWENSLYEYKLKLSNNNAEIDECSICLEELNDCIIKTKCSHSFHIDCISKIKSKICPNCRQRL